MTLLPGMILGASLTAGMTTFKAFRSSAYADELADE